MRLPALILCLLVCGCQDYNVLFPGDGSVPDDGSSGDDPGADPGGDPGGDPGSDPGSDPGPQECPAYPGAMADCAYQLVRDPAADCLRADCLDQPCQNDDACPQTEGLEAGGRCVLGNCVFCAENPDCFGPEVCRAGRCLERNHDCREYPACDDFQHCDIIMISALYCPVCNCDSLYQHSCNGDHQCFSTIDRLEYCVYGRCVECVDDDDCEWGQCLPPGMCYQTWPHPSVLYGTWLVGWAGGLNHYSYFRFEPDGTLRRGSYPAQEPWADDVPGFPCTPDQPPPLPYLGTWEPLISDSGRLAVQMTLNIPCDPLQGWSGSYAVELAGDEDIGMFLNIDGDRHYDVLRVPTDSCAPDFSTCRAP